MGKFFQAIAACLLLYAMAVQGEVSTAPRSDLLHCFYGDSNYPTGIEQTLAETAGYVNCTFPIGIGDHSSAIGRANVSQRTVQNIQTARAYGIRRTIVPLQHLVYTRESVYEQFRYRGEEARTDMRDFFLFLKARGWLDSVWGIVTMDEPNLEDANGVQRVSAETTRLVNSEIRLVMSEFPELAETKIVVIYASRGNPLSWPGIESFDIVGFDDYGKGWRGYYSSLKTAVRHDQKIMLVPGGAFNQDPMQFLEVAENDPQVAVIVSFIQYDNWDMQGARGIRSNGMAEAYCEMGALILHPEIPLPDCGGYPQAMLRVNNSRSVSVAVGDMIHYDWNSLGATNWFSTWSTNAATCNWGSLSGPWEAGSASGSSAWPADISQVGCTFQITFVACGLMSCAEDTIWVTVTEAVPRAPLPVATLTINGSSAAVAGAGEMLNYKWNASNATRTASWWSSVSDACGGGAMSGEWIAADVSGAFSWPADISQAGCTYHIVYSACNDGGACALESIRITVLPYP